MENDDNVDAGGAPGSQDNEESHTVSVKQFKAALANQEAAAEAKLSALRSELEALKTSAASAPAPAPAPASSEPPEYTRTQLKAFVAAGHLTEDQADQYWETQLERKIKKQVASEVGQTVTGTTRAERLRAELAGYKEVEPAAWDKSSEVNKKVQKEHLFLTETLGHPLGPETDLAALRAALGPLAALRAAKDAKPGSSDGHQEVGGGNPPGGNGGGDPVKSLTAREKAHYTRLIDRGVYKDWDAVREERKFAKQRAASRA